MERRRERSLVSGNSRSGGSYACEASVEASGRLTLTSVQALRRTPVGVELDRKAVQSCVPPVGSASADTAATILPARSPLWRCRSCVAICTDSSAASEARSLLIVFAAFNSNGPVQLRSCPSRGSLRWFYKLAEFAV